MGFFLFFFGASVPLSFSVIFRSPYRDERGHRGRHLVDALVVADVAAVGRDDGDPFRGVMRGAPSETVKIFSRFSPPRESRL